MKTRHATILFSATLIAETIISVLFRYGGFQWSVPKIIFVSAIGLIIPGWYLWRARRRKVSTEFEIAVWTTTVFRIVCLLTFPIYYKVTQPFDDPGLLTLLPWLASFLFFWLTASLVQRLRKFFNKSNEPLKPKSSNKNKILIFSGTIACGFLSILFYPPYAIRSGERQMRALCDSIPIGSSYADVFKKSELMNIKPMIDGRKYCETDPKSCDELGRRQLYVKGFAFARWFCTVDYDEFGKVSKRIVNFLD